MALDTSFPLILCIRSIPLSHLFFLENTSQVSVPLSISTAHSWSKPRSFLTWTTAAAFLPSRVLLILHLAAREVFLETPILRDILCLKPFPHVVYRARRDPARLSSLIALRCSQSGDPDPPRAEQLLTPRMSHAHCSLLFASLALLSPSGLRLPTSSPVKPSLPHPEIH